MVIKKGLIVGIFIIISIVACSETPEPVEVTTITEIPPTPLPTPTPIVYVNVIEDDFGDLVKEVDDRVTFTGYSTREILTLDPQLAVDKVSLNYIENLFVQLTNYDPVTNEIVPETAESWEISNDGRLYTFYLRTDIPWVYHNPVTGKTTQEIDEAGKPRFVTAHDFANGIRRACHPSTSSNNSSIIASLIVGCEAVLNAENSDAISQELINAIGVNVLDEATLTIELNAPASFFLSMTPMSILSATPFWAIEEYGNDWIEAGNIVTNGRYVLPEWIHNVRATIIRNPLMPQDMRGTGNIEKHEVYVLPNDDTGYALWLNKEVDISAIPEEDLESHLAEFPGQTIQTLDLDVFFISFQTTIPPFDNVHVRRAFSAAFDREKYIDEWRQGQGLPMKHLTPPGIFGALPIDEIGVGFDPEFARAELAAASYPNCEGFPQITLAGYAGQFTLFWGEFAQEQWQEHLGCTKDQILFVQPIIDTIGPPPTIAENSDLEGYHMFTLGWRPDYPDQNNWVGDLLLCYIGAASTERTCNEVDGLIIEARQEIDPARRIELYRQIEEAFFGPEGEFPVIPIFARAPFSAVQLWYDYTPVPFFGDQWYNDSIDKNAKEIAQIE